MSNLFNTSQKFGTLTKSFHWGVGLSIILLICIGLLMEEMAKSDPLKPLLYLTHKSIGMLVLPVALVWVVSWLSQKKPTPLKEIKKPLHRLSRIVHTTLILCAVGMPLSGWVMSSAFSGKGVSIFNLFTIPPIVGYDPSFARAVLGLHILISWVLISFAGLHILAALYHHFIRKNIILQRMLPLVKPIKAVKKTKKPSNIHHLGRK